MLALTTLQKGQTLRTRSGRDVTVVSYVPQAVPEMRLVVVDAEGEIHAYWDDGKYALDRRPCGMDIVGVAQVVSQPSDTFN